MTNKRTKQRNSKVAMKNLVTKVQRLKVKEKKTPFADVGSIVGNSLGSIFGKGQIGKGIGKWLGSGIGSIFGSGDYVMTGPTPDYNVLNGQVPKFSSTHATNLIAHREYLGDVVGTTNFTNSVYPLNPGQSETFPWLQAVAAGFQQYRFHGVMFEFKSLVTDFVTGGAPGYIIMGTNYNATQAPYTTKQEIENSEFAVSCKPTCNLVHMIECKPDETQNKLFNVRVPNSSISGQDLRFSDYGNFQLVTGGSSAVNGQVIGELWVTYLVEFYKPVLQLENSFTTATTYHTVRSGVTSAVPLGTAALSSSGTLSATVTSSLITIVNAVPGVYYSLQQLVQNTTTAVNNVKPLALTSGAVALQIGANIASIGATTFNTTTGTAANDSCCTQWFKATSSTIVLTPDGSGTIGAGPSINEIFINTIDSLVTA